MKIYEELARLAALSPRQSAIGWNTVTGNRRVVGRSGDHFVILQSEEILVFQAEGEFVRIVTAEGPFWTKQRLRAIQDQSKGEPFERVHRNALVNLDHVRKLSPISSQRWLLTLSNSLEITVSKRQARSIQKILD